MYNKIKPLPTQYGSVKYRSKLEAQWALYLTLIGVKYQYEVKTFVLGTKRYTPDFKINNNLWLEIKPKIFTLFAVEKVVQLATIHKLEVALCAGDFYKGLNIAKVSPEGIMTFNYRFAYCPNCKTVRFTNTDVCPACYRILTEYEDEYAYVRGHSFGTKRKRRRRKKN